MLNFDLYHHNPPSPETHTDIHIFLPLIQLAGPEEIICKGRLYSKKISIVFCKSLFQTECSSNISLAESDELMTQEAQHPGGSRCLAIFYHMQFPHKELERTKTDLEAPSSHGKKGREESQHLG